MGSAALRRNTILVLLEAQDVRIEIPTPSGTLLAVDGASFAIGEREIAAIVGESGAGKTTLANALIGLPRPPARMVGGRVLFHADRVSGAGHSSQDRVRGSRIGYVVSNASSHLDPLRRIGGQIESMYRMHQDVGTPGAREKALQMLSSLGIPDPQRLIRAYPHQISGGMAQRVVIGMAIANDPDLLIADEPTSGLDVTLQRRIMTDITQEAKRRGAAVLLVTHNLGLAAAYCERILVMYSGQILEDAPAATFFDQHPQHPYSAHLLAATSGMKLRARERSGSVRLVGEDRERCVYASVCPAAVDRCRAEMPALRSVRGNWLVRCHLTRQEFESLLDYEFRGYFSRSN